MNVTFTAKAGAKRFFKLAEAPKGQHKPATPHPLALGRRHASLHDAHRVQWNDCCLLAGCSCTPGTDMGAW